VPDTTQRLRALVFSAAMQVKPQPVSSPATLTPLRAHFGRMPRVLYGLALVVFGHVLEVLCDTPHAALEHLAQIAVRLPLNRALHSSPPGAACTPPFASPETVGPFLMRPPASRAAVGLPPTVNRGVVSGRIRKAIR
jgi:hypothetical protein